MAGFAVEAVEFEVVDDERFRSLVNVFEALRAAKSANEWKDDDYWLSFFDAESRATFWWPTPDELKDWSRRWFSTPVPQRFTDPSLVTPWEFGSMIEAFRNGDYDLRACERLTATTGQISFEPRGWPYGGTGCMRALVNAFGHHVTAEPDN
jgi:hypothetical protein